MFKIVRKEQFSEKVFLLEIEAPLIAKSRKPGNFVIVRVDNHGERMPLNDVLLTGSTGFLGIHILYELIQNYDNKVYCLVRPSGGLSAEKRLQNLMFYYFENDFSELFG